MSSSDIIITVRRTDYACSYMTSYFGLVTMINSVYSVCWYIFVYGSIQASAIIHKDLVATVLSSTLRWLDMTPTSRIIARCTADVQAGTYYHLSARWHSVLIDFDS